VLNSKYHGVPQNRERVFIVGHLRGTPRPEVFPIGQNDQLSERENESGRGQSQAELSTTVREGMGGKADSTFVASNIKQLNNPTHSNERIYGKEGLSSTLNTAQGGNRQPNIIENAKIRRLTPLECERLQGFPDGWTEGLSDTQRYKTLGNAVTVNVIESIFTRLLPS